MEAPYTIRNAVVGDIDTISALLKQADLFPQDVLAAGTRYWVAEDRSAQVVGCLGMEFGKGAVLLKSVAVFPAYRKQGIALQLVNQALAFAAAQGYRYAYLFSVRSGGYWQRLGFREAPVEELIQVLPDSYQVQHFSRIGKLARETAWRKDLGPAK